jgi:HK97 family phage prohead protease
VEDYYKDVVVPGAFKKSLAEWKARNSMPALLWQHNSAQPLGVYEEMFEDDRGLYVRGKLLKDYVHQAGEAYALMKAGAVTGLSIGYRTIVDEYDRETGITTLKELDLWEVSAVTFPANDLARVESVKNVKTKRDFENFLRESGFTKSEAVRIASTGFERRDSARDNAELTKLINENIAILGG